MARQRRTNRRANPSPWVSLEEVPSREAAEAALEAWENGERSQWSEELQEDIDSRLRDIQRKLQYGSWEPDMHAHEEWRRDGWHTEQIAEAICKEYSIEDGALQKRIKVGVEDQLKREHVRPAHRDLFKIAYDGVNTRQTELSQVYIPSELFIRLDEEDVKIPEKLVMQALKDEFPHLFRDGNEAVYFDGEDAWTIRDDGDPLKIVADTDELNEWVHDARSSYYYDLYDKDPTAAKQKFMEQLPSFAGGNELRAMMLPHVPRELGGEHPGEGDIPDDVWSELWTTMWGDTYEDVVEDLKAAITDFVSLLDAPSRGLNDPERVVGTIAWDSLDASGRPIKEDQLPENDRSPWTVIRLTTGDLAREGRTLRHCVGKPSMGYVKAVAEEQIEIWSVRTPSSAAFPDGKPVFTIEVGIDFYDTGAHMVHDAAHQQWRAWMLKEAPRIDPSHGDEAIATYMGKQVEQVRGKVNRIPGFADAGRSQLKFPQEVMRLVEFFLALDVNPYAVKDLSPGIAAMGGFERDPHGVVSWPKWKGKTAGSNTRSRAQLNPGVPAYVNDERPRGFDSPYEPTDEA